MIFEFKIINNKSILENLKLQGSICKFSKLQGGLNCKIGKFKVWFSPSPNVRGLNCNFYSSRRPDAGDGVPGRRRPPQGADNIYNSPGIYINHQIELEVRELAGKTRGSSPSPAKLLLVDSADSGTSDNIWRHVHTPGNMINMMVSFNFTSTSWIKKP